MIAQIEAHSRNSVDQSSAQVEFLYGQHFKASLIMRHKDVLQICSSSERLITDFCG